MSAGACPPDGPATLDHQLLSPQMRLLPEDTLDIDGAGGEHPARLRMGPGAKKAWKEK